MGKFLLFLESVEKEFIVHYVLKDISDYPTTGKTKISVKVRAKSKQLARNEADKKVDTNKYKFDGVKEN
jgi:hypothetical protein